jgi:hypothetical protein
MPIVNASLMKWTNTKTERFFDEAITDQRPAKLDLNLQQDDEPDQLDRP